MKGENRRCVPGGLHRGWACDRGSDGPLGSRSVIQTFWLGRRARLCLVLNDVQLGCSDVPEDSLAPAIQQDGQQGHWDVQLPVVVRSPKAPHLDRRSTRSSTGRILSIFGGCDSHSKRKSNVQMNILKNFHLSFYEISALAIFYHANQALFSFKKKICKNYYNPGRLNF